MANGSDQERRRGRELRNGHGRRSSPERGSFPHPPPTFSGIGALIYPGKAPTEAFWRETNSKRSKKQSLRSPALPGYISPSGGSGKKIETLDCGGGEALPLRTHLSLPPSSLSFFCAEFTASSLPFLDRRDAFAVDRERERERERGIILNQV